MNVRTFSSLTVYVSVHPSVYVSVSQSVRPSINQSTILSDERPMLEGPTIISVSAVHQPFYISICISTLPTQHTKSMSMHVSVGASFSPSVSQPVYVSIRPSFSPSVLQSIRQSARLSMCQFVRSSFSPCVHEPVSLSMCQSVRPSVRPSVCQSVRPSMRLRASVHPVHSQPKSLYLGVWYWFSSAIRA